VPLILEQEVVRMRTLAFLACLAAVTGAHAGEYDVTYRDADAVSGRLVYEARFGGERGLPAARSFQLQFGTEAQLADKLVPMRAEYRVDTQRFLVNGLDVERTLVARQGEEGGMAALWGGWFPLVVVIGAASLIIVDGQDQDLDGTGSN
jgi:hypothetical protein